MIKNKELTQASLLHMKLNKMHSTVMRFIHTKYSKKKKKEKREEGRKKEGRNIESSFSRSRGWVGESRNDSSKFSFWNARMF